MAQDIDMTAPGDKGKGKAGDEKKDDKPQVNGKKDNDKAEGAMLDPNYAVAVANGMATAGEELSEEDQQLKNDLDMLVERLTVRKYVLECLSRSSLLTGL
jgi:26S proteasome regulatory subunit N1